MKNSNNILLSSRTFNLYDQNIFAKFSGDFNPIHLDSVQARRTISGQCIVHGIHVLMWALESLLLKLNITPSAINVKFLKPIFLNEKVFCIYDENSNKIKVIKNSLILSDITLSFESKVESNNFNLKCNVAHNSPFIRDVNDLINLPVQDFFYRGEIQLAILLFPNISNAFGREVCCEIASISEIVGMQIPGLYSLLLTANIKFKRNESESNFYIEHFDERFNLFKIRVNATSLNCKIESFLRPRPTNSASLFYLKTKVNNSEFCKINALIIGGSRGLGESVAKLIALGGGETVITYSLGYEDCLKISRDISDINRKCSIAKINIPDDLHLVKKLGQFNQIYYFPTPKIFGKRNLDYDKNLYSSFYEIYVKSFEALVNNLNKPKIKTSIFYPSTIAINTPIPDLAEYIDAKIAGESLCEKLNNRSNISIYVSRIPRTQTDQTMSLFSIKSENPEEVMLPIIRKMTNFI